MTWLLHDLVAALPSSDFVAVVDLQTHLLAKVQFVGWIVSGNGDSLAVDEAIELERCAQSGELLHDLLHFAISQRHFIEPVLAAIVLKKDALPIRQQVRLARVFDDIRVSPTTLAQLVDHGGFKIGFFGKGGHG